MKKIFCIGMLMGLTDLLPGISGGSIAFLTNIYDRWLVAIKSIHLKHLLFFRFKKFLKDIDWKFLTPLFFGLLFSIASFSSVIHHLLNTSFRAFTYLFFVMLIVISSCFIAKDVPKTTKLFWIPLSLGLYVSLVIFNEVAVDIKSQNLPIYILLGGMIASCAMLLPGISGSSVLVILNLYEPLMYHLHHLFRFNLRGDSYIFLGYMFTGILLGVALFSRVVLWIYRKYKQQSASFFVGLMLGSCKLLLPNSIHPLYFIIFFVCFYLLLRKFLFNRIIISK